MLLAKKNKKYSTCGCGWSVNKLHLFSEKEKNIDIEDLIDEFILFYIAGECFYSIEVVICHVLVMCMSCVCIGHH